MSKTTSIILIILLSADIAPHEKPESEHYSLAERQLALDPLTGGLIFAGILLLIPFISPLWRKNPDYQVKVYEMKNNHPRSLATKVMERMNKIFVKDLINRCLSIVKVNVLEDEQDYLPYYMNLCSSYGHFVLNHLPMSIKMFDMAFNFRYFQLFLVKERILYSKGYPVEIIDQKNRRFLYLLKSNIFNLEDPSKNVVENQNLNCRIINVFYGGFWDFVYRDLFDNNFRPIKIPKYSHSGI